MTTLNVVGKNLIIEFPGWERLMAGRGTYTVPRDAISSVEVSEWTSEILGMRSGLVISGVRKLGTFRHPNGTRRLVSMSRGMPLLRIRLHDRRAGGGFNELLISTMHATEVKAELTAA